MENKKIEDLTAQLLKEIGEDPYYLVATAWVESRIKAGRISHTGDYGIFQINWRFWARKSYG